MSESPFPFNDNDDQVAEDGATAQGSRTRLLGLVALAGVAVAAGGFFLLGGSGDSEEVAFVPTARSAQPRVSAAPAPPVAAIPAAADAALGTNPFLALVKPPVDVAPAVAGGAGPPSPGASPKPLAASPAAKGFVGASGASAPGVVAPPTTVAKPSPAPAPSRAPSTVALSEVVTTTGAPVATLVMGGKEFQGGKGAVLGGKLLVQDLEQDASGEWIATVKVGESRPFKLFKGSEVVIPT